MRYVWSFWLDFAVYILFIFVLIAKVCLISTKQKHAAKTLSFLSVLGMKGQCGVRQSETTEILFLHI